jgi:polyphosphate kinase
MQLFRRLRFGRLLDLSVLDTIPVRSGLRPWRGNRLRGVVGRVALDPRRAAGALGARPAGDGSMHRNLSCRVETVTPITTPGARQRLWEVLETLLHDERQAWQMDADGVYTQLEPATGADARRRVGAHAVLMALAMARDIDSLPGYTPVGAPVDPPASAARPPRAKPHKPRRRVHKR